jgi:hypothetical protein
LVVAQELVNIALGLIAGRSGFVRIPIGMLIGRQKGNTNMSAPTVQISESSHRTLKELAEQTGQPMADVLDKALDAYRRQVFFEQLNAGYAELRADPAAWAAHQAELKQWDATLMDGLDPAERWTDDGRCVRPEKNEPGPNPD